MFRVLRVIAVSVVLTSCTTTEQGLGPNGERLEMTGLEDMSLAFIKTQWGEPDGNIPKGEGRLVSYKNIRSRDEDPVTGKVTIKSCQIRLELTRELLVKNWDYENCRIIPTGK